MISHVLKCLIQSIVFAALILPGIHPSFLHAQASTAAATTETLPTSPVVENLPTQPATAATLTATATAPTLQILPAKNPGKASLGSNDQASGYKMQANLTKFGAGLWWITLTDYSWKNGASDRYAVLTDQYPDGSKTGLYPLAARAIIINGQRIDLATASWDLVGENQTDRVTYALQIADALGLPLLKIERTFSLVPGSYEITLHQTLTNLSNSGLQVVWEQNGPGDMPADDGGAANDRREYIAGYFDLTYDPAKNRIYTQNTIQYRAAVLDASQYNFTTKPVPGADLVWLATVNRYFALAIHPLVKDDITAPAQVPSLNTDFPQATLGIDVRGKMTDKSHDNRVGVLTLQSRVIDIPAGQSAQLNLAFFAGPRSPQLFSLPPYKAMGLSQLIIYNLGCFCTFQWLADFLFSCMTLFHMVTRDWGLAIIVLVLVVRLILHPITRKSQIQMMKMQKGMAAIQPEIDKLKKKFPNEPQKVQAEQLKLMRERGINPMNMFGCLPMFLQMPIWVALYAMLYFAIDLRQTPGFYGVFQAVSGGHWSFLADLSAPDNFIVLPESWHFTIPLLSIPVTGIHILPLLMGIVFYLQFKYTTPPPANEQAAQQQKIMMYSTWLFPIMMYATPSGLTLYIMTSTAAGIVDSYIIKQHIKKEEEAGTLFQPKAVKPGGFMEKMQKMIEERQRAIGNNSDLGPRDK